MGWLKRLFASEQSRLRDEILAGLTEDYNSEIRLAKQLRAHAEIAPYAFAKDQLLRLADVEESQAERLREHITRLGGRTATPEASPRGGRNHWARLVFDLDDDRSAAKRYLEQAIRWEDHDPELASLLRSLEREEQQHRIWLQDLIARSDPHASN